MEIKHYTDGKKKVIAVGHTCFKKYRSVAICSPEDNFDFEEGKDISTLHLLIQQKDAIIKTKKRDLKTLEDYYEKEKVHLLKKINKAENEKKELMEDYLFVVK